MNLNLNLVIVRIGIMITVIRSRVQGQRTHGLAGLRQLAAKLHPGGIFALWSDDPPDDDVGDAPADSGQAQEGRSSLASDETVANAAPISSSTGAGAKLAQEKEMLSRQVSCLSLSALEPKRGTKREP